MTRQDVVTAFLAVLGVYLAVVLVLLVLPLPHGGACFAKPGGQGGVLSSLC